MFYYWLYDASWFDMKMWKCMCFRLNITYLIAFSFLKMVFVCIVFWTFHAWLHNGPKFLVISNTTALKRWFLTGVSRPHILLMDMMNFLAYWNIYFTTFLQINTSVICKDTQVFLSFSQIVKILQKSLIF